MMELTRFNRNPWSIFDELVGLQEEFDRVFERPEATRPAQRPGNPPLNVWSSEKGLVIDAELPGMEPGNVDISVDGDELTLSGKTDEGHSPEEATTHRRERIRGEFKRTLHLPFRAEAGAVKANYKDGLLRITVPRAAEDKPRKIEVRAA